MPVVHVRNGFVYHDHMTQRVVKYVFAKVSDLALVINLVLVRAAIQTT
jgi:hypothetical protein